MFLGVIYGVLFINVSQILIIIKLKNKQKFFGLIFFSNSGSINETQLAKKSRMIKTHYKTKLILTYYTVSSKIKRFTFDF